MKLIEAIILGDTLKQANPRTFISPDGSCGCAFGGALLAVGITAKQYIGELTAFNEIHELPCVLSRWPWIEQKHILKIGELYWLVYEGKATIEDVAAYVRSVEPAEQIAAVVELETEPKAEVCQ